MKITRSIFSNRNFHCLRRAFTLMEVVIALLVTALTIPLLLGALGTSAQSRQDMAADTTSAWIARNARDEFLRKWEQDGTLVEPIPEGRATTPALVLLYSSDGALLAQGSGNELHHPCHLPDAFFVAAIYATPHLPGNGTATEFPLAAVSMRVAYPAKAPAPDRERLYYQSVSMRKGGWK